MPVLGYWSIRALGEPIRTLLQYTGTEFEDKMYTSGPPPDYDRSDWLDVKFKLGLSLPNLPYYIDGDIKLTESSAILRHLARQHGLAGASEAEKRRIDVTESIFSEQTWAFIRFSYSPNNESEKCTFDTDLKAKLQKCATILGPDPYTAGQNISFTDFLLLELLDRYLVYSPTALDEFPSLQAFLRRMLELPAVKARRDSPQFQKIKTRLWGRSAKFGGGEESY